MSTILDLSKASKKAYYIVHTVNIRNVLWPIVKRLIKLC